MEAEIDTLTDELKEVKAAPKPTEPPKSTVPTPSSTQPNAEHQSSGEQKEDESKADDEQSTTGASDEVEYAADQNDQNNVNNGEYQQ